MVDALREARRVLTPHGVLIDVRPLTAPLGVAAMAGSGVVWAKTVESFSAPEDVAAADAAVWNAVSRGWLVFRTSHSFNFDIYCDTAAELKIYAEARKLRGAEIPYDELEKRQRALRIKGKSSRLRCRRPWILNAWRKK